MEGIIKDYDDDSVRIDDVLYRLGENVKPQFLRKGKCEYSLSKDGETATFIKMDKPPEKKFGKPKSEEGEFKSLYRKPMEILRQECLNTAKEVLVLMNPKEFTVKQLLEIAEQLEKYVKG